MNIIKKSPVNTLGYNFIPPEFIPEGSNEYALRNMQNRIANIYRQLSAYEIEVLVRNRNTSDNWNNILVSNAFTPELVQNCKFFGLVRIGKMEQFYLEFNNLRRPVGLYNSTIISCDIGDNCVIDNVNYISHYILGDEVILVNINELSITNYAKFGNGTLKEGEPESIRIWMELCNENGGRKIIPFEGMLPGDAFIWTQHRDDEVLQQKLKEFTDNRHDKRRGYYGTIGDRTVIKNCKIIKDVKIGSDAYIKGSNKMKNLTIRSSPEAMTQIGEGCELVNGIIDHGCRIFYGVKAVRFVMASHSQLKYGARLINSYLGNNSTISCCEVLNSLIFPSHEQHHNNSFLCAALVAGQSNMAAGATIGSNHNSRGADGEIQAGRGFWPGLCVSLKHNSRFASFTIIAKGDYPAELDIPIPFSLVSNNVSKDMITVMPAYWFQYNMYALARNSWKYVDRDQRIDKDQLIEFDYLAPDTVNEIIHSLELFKKLVGEAYFKSLGKEESENNVMKMGEKLLEEKSPEIDSLEIIAPNFENSKRIVKILKVQKAYSLFKELIQYYAAMELIKVIDHHKIGIREDLMLHVPARPTLTNWKNVGGQLIIDRELEKLIEKIKTGKILNWEQVHKFYHDQAKEYPIDKLNHAVAAYQKVYNVSIRNMSNEELLNLITSSVSTKQWIVRDIFESRAKDYKNPFRKMVYENDAEMDTVLGSLDDNSFIKQEKAAFKTFKKRIDEISGLFSAGKKMKTTKKVKAGV
jgi:hypothetical protein